ncbi:MAG: hypothetical protein ACYDIC_05025 [Desulfobaccales bacterium]
MASTFLLELLNPPEPAAPIRVQESPPLVDSQTCAGEGRDHEYCVDLKNRIVTIFAGAHIKPGDYPEGKGITHVNILRTLEAMYGLSKAGTQQPNAAGGGITDNYIVTDVFEIRK